MFSCSKPTHAIIRIYYKKMDDALRQFKSEIFQGLAHPTRIAIVELLNFPLGTVLGVYALWVLLSPETDPLFSPRFQ